MNAAVPTPNQARPKAHQNKHKNPMMKAPAVAQETRSQLFVAQGRQDSDRSPVAFSGSEGPVQAFQLHVTSQGIRSTTPTGSLLMDDAKEDTIKFEHLVDWVSVDRGQQGEVFQVRHVVTKTQYAVKRIDLLLLMGQNALGQVERKTLQVNVQRELSMLYTRHNSDNIVKVHNAYYVKPNLYILMDYADYSLTRLCKTLGNLRIATIKDHTAKHFRTLGTRSRPPRSVENTSRGKVVAC